MKKKQATSKRSKVVLAASAAIAIPMMSMPAASHAQKGQTKEQTAPAMQKTASRMYIKFASAAHKLGTSNTIAGYDGTHTIFKRPDGTMFYLDEKTGDMKNVDARIFPKMPNLSSIDRTAHKLEMSSPVELVGVDQKSHVIMKNTAGEQFYIDQATGDFIFVK